MTRILALDGSDAMHPDPDYSAAYVVLRTDGPDADDPSRQGHGLAFTIGRGTEIVCRAIDALTPLVLGVDVEELGRSLGPFARRLTGDSQLRCIGPEKGAIHLAVNRCGGSSRTSALNSSSSSSTSRT